MAASMVELLPGKLFWAPEHASAPAGFEGQFAVALDMCSYRSDEDAKSSGGVEYNVMHYSAKAAGYAFGPLGLDVMLRFCRGLHKRLSDGSATSGGLALGTAPGDMNQRTNVAVLLGAYFLLMAGWSVDQLAAKIGQGDADLKFACSWSRKDRPEPKRIMSVKDCWLGLEMGHGKGWLDSTCLESDTSTDFICKKWRDWVATYDCSWVVPGFILVGADPVTTALDPNPSTFSVVFPPAHSTPRADPIDLQAVTPELASPQSLATPQSAYKVPQEKNIETPGTTAGAAAKALDQVIAPDGDASSVDTVCKEYRLALESTMMTSDAKALDFVSFLKNAGISKIVRTNFSNEPGMPKSGGYDAEKFKAHGFSHTDAFIVDTHGGLPMKADVKKVLMECPDGKPSGGAVYVHCKGGFGRSIMLACCLAVERLDIPGTALLGWVRMVRPGCVNTQQQEMMLKSFKGRNDVRRFAGLPVGPGGSSGSDDNPKCGCSVQ